MSRSPTLVPCLRYRDAPGAIDFLCRAFGFASQVVFTDPDDAAIVHHAQLSLGNGLVMLGSARPGVVQERHGWKTPAEAGGITQCVYAIVADPDAHHATAITAGARIIDPPHDNEGYPGRSYSAADPEGNVWSFGSYTPDPAG